MKHNAFPLRITDAVLLDPTVPAAAKLVLAQTLGYRNYDPSLTQLEGDLPLKRESIHAAQAWLEDHDFVVYDRPEHAWDRLPDSVRFNRSTRAAQLAPQVDPAHAEVALVELPPAVMAQIRADAGCKKNAAYHPLLALLYAREQRLRRALQMPDACAAWLLGLPNAKRAGNLRRDLLRVGVIKSEGRAQPCDIYTMPGGTVQAPDASQLDRQTTRNFRQLNVGGSSFTFYASGAECDQAARFLALVGEDAMLRVLSAARVATGVRARIGPILDTLRKLAESPEVSRSGHLSRPFGAPVSSVEGTGLLPLTSDLEELTSFAREALEVQEQEQERWDGEDEQHTAPTAPSRPGALPAELEARLASIFGHHGKPGRKAHTQLSDAWRHLAGKHDGDFNAAQLRIALQLGNDQLDRVADVPPTDRPRAYAALATACSYVAAPADDVYSALKAARTPISDEVASALGLDRSPESYHSALGHVFGNVTR